MGMAPASVVSICRGVYRLKLKTSWTCPDGTTINMLRWSMDDPQTIFGVELVGVGMIPVFRCQWVYPVFPSEKGCCHELAC